LIDILDRFKTNKTHTFLPVVNRNNEAMGIIREKQLREYAYSEYGRSLLANRSFDKTFDDFMTRIPVVDIHTPLERTLETVSGNEGLEGILITNHMKYVGFLSAQALIKIIHEKNLAAARDQNPLSKLPGNEMIYEYVSQALTDTQDTYVLVYFDFDNFKVYNDTYGFRQGDRVILLFAELLKQYTQPPERFAGHVGGDDFFMGVKSMPLDYTAGEVRAMAAKFRSNVESFYDHKAIENGGIETKGRDGRIRCFPLITVSAALLELPERVHRIYSPEEIGNLMAEMKKEAKRSSEKLCTASLCHFDMQSPGKPAQTQSAVIEFQAYRRP
jgi:diguanylate cyclase (GGDEF)-like protein